MGDDFYLGNSTFEFFLGVPVFHSRDLVHWRQIGHCLDRSEQVILHTGSQNGTGIFAPTIRHHGGVFYMVVTNVASGEGTGNFHVWAKDPASPWAQPIFLGTEDIDPSLFFNEDGSCWYTGTSPNGILLSPLDVITDQITGKPALLWPGTGGAYPEGPHLYKKDGWYYLLISEGGTERCHMITMARSRDIKGPCESCPRNPVLTNRSWNLGLDSIGHADLVEDQNGHWWAVCLGTRTFGYPQRHNLGRETMLIPVDWSGNWPVFDADGHALPEFETDKLPAWEPTEESAFRDAFTSDKLDFCWNHLYNPDPALYEYGQGALILHGNGRALKDADALAWLGRRQQLIGEHGVVLGQNTGQLLALLLYQRHGVVDDLAQGVQLLPIHTVQILRGNIGMQIHEIGILRLIRQEEGALFGKVAGFHRKHSAIAHRTVFQKFSLHQLKAAVSIA